MKPLTLAAMLALTAALAGRADAAVLLYEPFNYTTGTDTADNLAGNNGGTGFQVASSWAKEASLDSASVTTGMSFGTLATSGGKATLGEAGANGDYAAARQIGFNTPDTFYISHLFNLRSLGSNLQNVVEVRRNTSVAGDWNAPSSLRILDHNYGNWHSAIGINGAGAVTNLSQGPTGGDSEGGGTIKRGLNMMALVKVLYNSGTNQTTATMWTLEAADYDSVVADSIVSEAELNSVAHALGSQTIAGDWGYSIGDYLQLSIYRSAGSHYADFDELRFTTTLEEALGLSIEPIPSPAALPAGLALASLVAMRRRRRD